MQLILKVCSHLFVSNGRCVSILFSVFLGASFLSILILSNKIKDIVSLAGILIWKNILNMMSVSGIFRSVAANFVSHNTNLNVKKV